MIISNVKRAKKFRSNFIKHLFKYAANTKFNKRNGRDQGKGHNQNIWTRTSKDIGWFLFSYIQKFGGLMLFFLNEHLLLLSFVLNIYRLIIPLPVPNPTENVVYAWDPMPVSTITSPYVHSRVDSNTFTMGNAMPQSTLTQCYSQFYPPVRDLNMDLVYGFFTVLEISRRNPPRDTDPRFEFAHGTSRCTTP